MQVCPTPVYLQQSHTGLQTQCSHATALRFVLHSDCKLVGLPEHILAPHEALDL